MSRRGARLLSLARSREHRKPFFLPINPSWPRLVDALLGDTIIHRQAFLRVVKINHNPLFSMEFEAFFIDGTDDGIAGVPARK